MFSFFNQLEQYLKIIYEWYLAQNIYLKYTILFVALYIFCLGSLEFCKKILVAIPLKVIEILIVVLLAYGFVLFYKS